MTSAIFLCVFALLSFSPFALAVLPNGECSATDMTCELEDNNVIGIINGIASEAECEQQCLDNNGFCRVFTYYGSSGVPFRDTCLLLSDCIVLDACEDCSTKDVGPDCTGQCTIPVEGILGDNLIDFAVDITKEACASECEALLGCDVYTYHFSNSTSFPETCFLLTELLKPISPCDDGTCLSGSPGCNLNVSPCGFRANGVFYPTSIVVNDTMDVDVISGQSCGTLLAVAVGGGGTTELDAGSGSGYVEYVEISPPPTSGQFRAEIGGAQEATVLTDTSDGSTLLTADPGLDGGDYNGANGYSGGGGDIDGSGTGGDGGTDGGNGEASANQIGGRGSGLDISTIGLKNVVISPGLGGEALSSGSSGGGGGGVLVNDNGPTTASSEHGEGFGAGGGGYYDEAGYPGIMILEFI